MLFERCGDLVLTRLLGCSELVADFSESRLDCLELAVKAGAFLLPDAKALCVLVLESRDRRFVRRDELFDLFCVVGEIGCRLVAMHGLKLRRELVNRRSVFLTELSDRFCDCGSRRFRVLLCEFFCIGLVTREVATLRFETFLACRRELRLEDARVFAPQIVQGSLVRRFERGERILRICRSTGRSAYANVILKMHSRSLPASAVLAWD